MHHHDRARRSVLKTLAASAATVAWPAWAQQAYPSRTMRQIVGLAPGGNSDVIARGTAQAIEAETKQAVVVDNRPGGQFLISVNALLAEPPDGHTFMYIYNGYCAIEATQGLFSIEKSMIPVARTVTSEVLFMTRGDAPYKSMRELIAFAKANPGKINFGTFGDATLEHLKMAQIEQAAGVKFTPVPFKGGPDMAMAMMAGQIDCGLLASSFKQYLPSGKMRMLATLGEKRWKEFPDTPTITEAGVDVAPLIYWGGYVVRAGTPADRVDHLAKLLARSVQNPDLARRFAGIGLEVDVSDSPTSFRQQIRSDIAWMSDAYKKLRR